MNNAFTRGIDAQAGQLYRAQGIAGLIAAGGFLAWRGPMEGLAALFGAAVSLLMVWLLRRGVTRATQLAQHDPKRSMLVLYSGAVIRFVLVLALLGLGLGLLNLDPLAVLVGFGLAQFTNIVAARVKRRQSTVGGE